MKNSPDLRRPALAALLLASIVVFGGPVDAQYPASSIQGSGQVWTVPADTVIGVQMTTTLSSKTAHVGDRFSAGVRLPVLVNGIEVIPAGAVVEGRISQVTPAKRMNRSGTIAIEFDDLVLPNGSRAALVGTLTSDDPETRQRIDDESRVSGSGNKRPAVFVGAGGVLGAVLGGIAGGGKGAAVGGAAGVGAGVAAVLLSKGEEAEVPAGTPFGIQLRQPLLISDVPTVAANPTQPNQPDPSYDSNRDPGPPQNENPAASQNTSVPANPQPESTRDSDPAPNTAAEDGEQSPAASGPELIRRAQTALREQGYYEGSSDGVLNARTANALKLYQRDHKLPETGEVDAATARSLGVIGSAPPQPRPQTQSRPASQQGDQPSAPASPTRAQPSDREQQQPRQSGQPAGVAQQRPAAPRASSLDQQMSALMADYQRLAGVRLTDNGIEIDDRSRYGEAEVELLFALDSFANAVQLYGELSNTLQDGRALRSATLALAKQARRTDITITTSTSRTARSLASKWDMIRQEVLRLMKNYDIGASELDN